jgi:hypothetical protein
MFIISQKALASSALTIAIVFFLALTVNSQFTNPGCSSFSSQKQCLACQDRYYLLAGICFPVSPLCLTYDSTNGNCLTCYQTFMLVGSGCIPMPDIPFCLNYSAQGECLMCQDRYYLTPQGCQKVDDKCQTYSSDGNCTSCINNYLFYLNNCVKIIENCLNQTLDICSQCSTGYINGGSLCNLEVQYCQEYSQGMCVSCQVGYKLGGSQCVKTQLTMSPMNLVDNCTSYDSVTFDCIACEAYFQLIQGYCLPIPDPFCYEFNDTLCVQCSQGYIFDQEGHCKATDPLCKAYDSQGLCLSCYNGFTLSNKSCVIIIETLDPYCYELNGSICVKCSRGYRFDSQGKCISLDTRCERYDATNSSCLQCYGGFMVGDGGLCVLITEAGCLAWANQSCQSCSKGYYLFQGHCLKMDPYCSIFNYSSFTCLACYSGYVSLNNTCQLTPPSHHLFNCASISSNSTCSSCYFGFYLFDG